MKSLEIVDGKIYGCKLNRFPDFRIDYRGFEQFSQFWSGMGIFSENYLKYPIEHKYLEDYKKQKLEENENE